MRFETSAKITTGATQDEVTAALVRSFRKIAFSTTAPKDGLFTVTGIEQSFGSINRRDDTVVKVSPAAGGYLLTGDVHYRPSFMFWVILLICLFTWILWLLPIIFYMIQKSAVRTSVEKVFERVKNEFDAPASPSSVAAPASSIADLEALARLRDQGILTEEEFATKKRAILGT